MNPSLPQKATSASLAILLGVLGACRPVETDPDASRGHVSPTLTSSQAPVSVFGDASSGRTEPSRALLNVGDTRFPTLQSPGELP
ncbi:MAG: hypothetical protein QGI93_15070, partial [Planctomycetota bacterium]|nr:hypothetical protein [Planctomycetota bacterium]